MAFYIKELLLTGALTRGGQSIVVDQMQMVGAGISVNRAKALFDKSVFARSRQFDG